MFLTTGITVYLGGISMVILGWLLFRRPGVAFWTFAPISKANHYLKRPGAVLWVAGSLLTPIGLVAHFAQKWLL